MTKTLTIPESVELCNIFYQFEGRVFENYEDLKFVTKDYRNQHFDRIYTFKTWDDFETDFDNSLEEGNDIVTALEDAEYYTKYPSYNDEIWTEMVLDEKGIKY